MKNILSLRRARKHLQIVQNLCLLVPVLCLAMAAFCLPYVCHGQIAEEVHHELQEFLLQHQVHVLIHTQDC